MGSRSRALARRPGTYLLLIRNGEKQIEVAFTLCSSATHFYGKSFLCRATVRRTALRDKPNSSRTCLIAASGFIP
jgi:hypothetical protein